MLLRDRLTLLVLAILVATVVALVAVTDAAFGAFQRHELAQLAERDLARVDAMVRSGTLGDTFLDDEAMRIQFVASESRQMLPDPGGPALPELDAAKVVHDPLPDLEGAWMVAARPWSTPSGIEAGTIRIAVPMADAMAARDALRRVLAATGALALAVAAAIAVIAMRRVLRPLQRLAGEARAVDPANPGTLGYRGPADEVGMVADALARTLDGIRSHREAERERLADVAHELAAPLTVVTNHLRSLASTLSNGASQGERERLASAEAAADELLASSEDLLTVARGDLDARMSWEIVDLADVARRVAVAYPGVGLETVGSDARAVVDPVRVRQVLRNLLRNAVRAAGRPEGVHVRVVGPALAGADRVRIEVADDGPGLSEEAREAVFDRYVTGAGTTGLGLAVVRRLVEAMGGRVDVWSGPGVGATFVVELPSVAASLDDGDDPEAGSGPGDGVVS